jgi:hypothetical protein
MKILPMGDKILSTGKERESERNSKLGSKSTKDLRRFRIYYKQKN